MSSDINQVPGSQVIESVGSNQTPTPNGRDEIAHVLFLDVVGFTKLRSAKQRAVLAKLQEIVRGTEDFCAAIKAEQLIALPTGDGMALVFLTTLDGSGPAISCAEKIAEAVVKLKTNTAEEDANIQVRMGIHSGNIVRVFDVNGRPNVAGDGINTAQRVMDCGDIGHILLSDHAVHHLPSEPDRTDQCLDLGKVKVKHDQEVSLYNFLHGEIGNRELPKKIGWQIKEALQVRALSNAKKRRQQLLVAALCLVVVLAAVFWWRRPTPPPARPSLAVLPFTPGTQKNSSRAISKGLTEQFIRSFRHLTTIELTPLSTVRSTFTQNASGQTVAPPPREAAKELHARYILTGTAESYSDDADLDNSSGGNAVFSVKVTAALYDAETDAPVWSKEYPLMSFNQLITLQKTIVKEVTAKMGGAMRVTGDNFEAETKNSDAHWSYMQGRFWSAERPNAESQKLKAEDIARKAIQKYDDAINIDPGYARAHAGLTDMYASISGVTMDPKVAKDRAVKAAADAQAYGENQVEVYASVGTEKWWLERKFAEARLALLLSISLDSQFSDGHKRYSSFLAAQGEHQKAKEQIQLALGIEPESTLIQLTSAQNSFFAKEYTTALEQLRKIVSDNPKMSVAYRFLAMALEQNSKNLSPEALAEALETLKKGEGESNDDSDFLGARAHILAHWNQPDEALKIAKSLEKLKSFEKKNNSYVSPYNIALAYAAITGHENDALKWLNTAINIEFDPRVTWLKVDPRFAKLRESKKPEFNDFLLAIGLTP